jgi:hypothetical protein
MGGALTLASFVDTTERWMDAFGASERGDDTRDSTVERVQEEEEVIFHFPSRGADWHAQKKWSFVASDGHMHAHWPPESLLYFGEVLRLYLRSSHYY